MLALAAAAAGCGSTGAPSDETAPDYASMPEYAKGYGYLSKQHEIAMSVWGYETDPHPVQSCLDSSYGEIGIGPDAASDVDYGRWLAWRQGCEDAGSDLGL